MLVLTRRRGEEIVIGDEVVIKVVESHKDSVRSVLAPLGIYLLGVGSYWMRKRGRDSVCKVLGQRLKSKKRVNRLS